MKRILAGLSTFFLLFSGLVFLLFLSGNRQDFLPSSQFLLLRILKISSLLSLLAGLHYFVYLVTAVVRRRPWRIGSFFLALAAFGGGGVLLVLAHFILVATLPVI